MEGFVPLFNTALGSLTVFLQAATVWILLAMFRGGPRSKTLNWVNERAMLLVFFVSAGGVVGSLIYSEGIGYEPCSLCWWARIFLYPIAILSGMALYKRREEVAEYLLPLAAAGSLVTLYNSYLQYGGDPFLPCGAGAVSCAQRFVFEFGYVTIPLMAFSAFAFILTVLLARRKA